MLLLLATIAAGVPCRAQEKQREPVAAFVDVAVLPMDRERVLPHQTVVVRGSRIVQMGAAAKVRVPAGAVRVDGRGKFLMPGLGDMHVHVGYPSSYTVSVPDELFALVANGVTVVRDMHSGRPEPPADGTDDGDSWRLALRRRIAAGDLLAPRLYTAGDIDPSSPQAAARSVAALKAHGHDFVKVSLEPNSPAEREVFDSIVTVAKRVGLRVVGHVPPDVGVGPVLAARFASVEHLYEYFEDAIGVAGRWTSATTGIALLGWANIDTAAWMKPGYRFDGGKIRRLAEATARAGVWTCPTLNIHEQIQQMLATPRTGDTSWVRRRRISARALGRMVDFNRQMVRALQEADAGLILGTDMPFEPVPDPGFSVHQELASLVQAGLTPYQALATGTRNVAAFLGTLDSTGTVAVGKRADLVLLSGNPLQDIGYTAGPAGVMLGGRWLPRAELDARLDAFPVGVDSSQREWYHEMREARQQVWRH